MGRGVLDVGRSGMVVMAMGVVRDRRMGRVVGGGVLSLGRSGMRVVIVMRDRSGMIVLIIMGGDGRVVVMTVRGRGLIVVTMAGVMPRIGGVTVVVVRLVLVAHDSIPQPLCAVFSGEIGIT